MSLVLILNDEHYYAPKTLVKFYEDHKMKPAAVFVLPSFMPGSGIDYKLRYNYTAAKQMDLKFLVKYIFDLIINQSAIRKTCEELEIPYFRFEDVNASDFSDKLKEYSNSVWINICSQIYTSKTIKSLGQNIYNIHPSILPGHRGRFPMFWAAKFNHQQGMSCHLITPKIDGGPVIHQFKMSQEKTMAQMMDQFTGLIPDFVVEILEILKGNRKPQFYNENVEAGYDGYP